MNDDILVRNTEEFVKSKLRGEGTGHDWWHVVRIVNIARKIHSQEGGNWLVIHLTLLLHDVGDGKVIGQDEDDYSIAQSLLESQSVSPKTINEIMSIIKTMSYSKSFDNPDKNDSIEFKIVQDADRLDAMGAIGVARAFTYGGSRSRPLYDPDYTSREFMSSEDFKKTRTEGSTVHHFYDKLLLLKDKLNTETAKEVAIQRDEFMQLFLQEFLDEWSGQK